MTSTFTPVAHSPRPGETVWHDLLVHLEAVARRAALYAEPFDAAAAATLLGWWHDAGKLYPDWQARIRAVHAAGTGRIGIPHADVAMVALGQAEPSLGLLALLASAHHKGLYDANDLKTELPNAAKDARVISTVALARTTIAPRCPLVPLTLPEPIRRTPQLLALWLRLLHSALVDADCVDTEAFCDPVKAGLRSTPRPVLETLRDALLEQQASRIASAPDTLVNQHRATIYRDALAAAPLPPGFFSLTVPTGGGKTLTGMAFALDHAVRHGMRRVIVALPFTSIIEQNARVYREAFGEDAVVEHHSALDSAAAEAEDEDAERRRRLAAQSWDAPIIVTTTVQLFESLYAARNGALRKLHNIPRSVIILDEVQTLPADLLAATLDALRHLVAHFGCTVVLSTATQPAFTAEILADVRPPCHLPDVRELVAEPERHFEALRRVRYERMEGTPALAELVEHLAPLPQALVILNTVKDAHALIEALEAGGVGERVVHLSTRLCGAHRREVLAAVRERLDRGEPCLLVSTQVVEAGVDLDFPVVFRALGPLDSIVQAAGRCNREGRLGVSGGRVVVFDPSDGGCPRGAYTAARDQARVQLAHKPLDELHTAAIFQRWFRALYQLSNLDAHGVRGMEKGLRFAEVAKTYRLIDDDTRPVLIRRTVDDHVVEPILRDVRAVGLRGWHMRALQPYMVTLHRWNFENFSQQRLVARLYRDIDLFEWCGGYSDLYGLREQIDPMDLIIA